MSDLDDVRLLIGDTEPTDLLLEDAEITTLLAERTSTAEDGTTYVNVPAAAADAAGAIAAKFARHFSFAEDGQQFSVAQRVGHYLALETKLRARAGGESVPLVGNT